MHFIPALANIKMEINIESYEVLKLKATTEIQEKTQDLEGVINKRLESNDFESETTKIITELKSKGHILYSLNYDNDIHRYNETWGSNYHDMGANGLEIDFWNPGYSTVTCVISNKKKK